MESDPLKRSKMKTQQKNRKDRKLLIFFPYEMMIHTISVQ